ncbi:MAG: heme-binding protein [Candidatus Bathyarchaeia archaeon]|jgi:uncharacterized protein GlcG (DUF336 family)
MIQVSKLSWSDVERIIEAATKKAIEIKVPTNIAVTDEAGILLGFKRMDGALVCCAQLAIDKAYTSAALGVTTQEEWKAAQPGGIDYGLNSLYGGRLTTIGGGVPIKMGSQILGGIGVSTGTVEEDIATAQAGLSAFLGNGT